jgi:hypothetical protein
MARCRECNSKVWHNAEYCRHCGVHYPAEGNPLLPARSGIGPITKILSIMALFLIFVMSLLGASGDKHAATVQPTMPSCETDWTRCIDNADLANNYSSYGSSEFDCKSEAEKRAQYGDPKFPWAFPFATFHKGDDYPKTGIAILIEKDAQFQNGFGAMVHSEVTCTYDLRAKRVLSVDISPR